MKFHNIDVASLQGHFVLPPAHHRLSMEAKFDFLKLFADAPALESLKQIIQSGLGVPFELVFSSQANSPFAASLSGLKLSFTMSNEEFRKSVGTSGYLSGAIIHVLGLQQ